MGPSQLAIALPVRQYALEFVAGNGAISVEGELDGHVVEDAFNMLRVLAAGVLPEIATVAGDQIAMNRRHLLDARQCARLWFEPRGHRLGHAANEVVVEQQRPQGGMRRGGATPGAERLEQRCPLRGHDELLETQREQLDLLHLAHRKGTQQADVRSRGADEGSRQALREVLQGVHGALTLPCFVEEQEVPGEVDAFVEFQFDVADHCGRVQALGEDVLQARLRAEVQPVNSAKLLRPEELADQPRLAHLPRAVDQQRLADRLPLPPGEFPQRKPLQHGLGSFSASASESPTRS